MKIVITEQDINNMVKEAVTKIISNKYHITEIQEETLINEGFNDFIKKFALTAAIATSCITAAAKPTENYTDNNKLNKEITQKENSLVKFGYAQNKDDIHVIIKQGSKTSVTQALARQEFYNKTINQGINAKIVKTEYFYNQDTDQNVVAIFYVIQ